MAESDAGECGAVVFDASQCIAKGTTVSCNEEGGHGAGGGVAVHGERDLLGASRKGQERRDEKAQNAVPQYGFSKGCRGAERGFRRSLGAVAKALGRALDASAKKRTRLLTGATKKLAAVDKRAGKLGGKKISAQCAARVDGLVERVTQLID